MPMVQTHLSTLRARAAARGLRIWKVRENSREYAEYGPYALILVGSNGITERGLSLDELADLLPEAKPFADLNAHSARFLKVANAYPYMVARAYGGELKAALRDTDEQVAARVAEYERANGLEVRDWVRIGRDDEGREDDENL